MTKAKRIKVYDKYDAHCAYCGIKLTLTPKQENTMHEDHIKAILRDSDYNKIKHKFIQNGKIRRPDNNNIENLNPSCKDCNNYKGSLSIEEFRTWLLQMLNEKHEYLFKSKTKASLATKYGVIQIISKWDGKFYFEKNVELQRKINV